MNSHRLLARAFLRYLLSARFTQLALAFIAVFHLTPIHAAPPLDGLDGLDDNDLDAAAPPAFFIVGHRAKIQEIVREQHAWTLGEDGQVVHWQQQDGPWVPVALQRVDDAFALSLHGDFLQVYTPSFAHRLSALELQPVAQLPAARSAVCGEELSWRLDAHQRVCAKRGAHPSVCARDSLDTNQLHMPVCLHGAREDCIRISTDTGTRAWCLNDANELVAHHSPNRDALRFPAPDNFWVVRGAEGWAKEEDASPVQINRGRAPVHTPCYNAVLGVYERCTQETKEKGPETHVIRAPRILEILPLDSTWFIALEDGWLARTFPPRTDEPAATRSLDFVQAQRQLDEQLERIWLPGDVLGAGLHQGKVHIAYCHVSESRWEVFDVSVAAGTQTRISDGSGPCPQRADYHEGVLRLSFETEAQEWTLWREALQTVPIRSPFFGAIEAQLYAAASRARACPAYAWDLWVDSRLLGTIPLATKACAHSVSGTRWQSDFGASHGPALMLSSSTGSFVYMMDEDTLESFTLRVRTQLSPRTRIHREQDGSWLLADPDTGVAQRFDANGDEQGTESTLVLGTQAWFRMGNGVLQNRRGDLLLVTDEGMALNHVGAGPMIHRTLHAGNARLLDDHQRLASELLRVWGAAP